MNKSLIVSVVLIVSFGAVGFFAGVKYQEGKAPQFARQFVNSPRGQFQGRSGNGINFQPINGEIISSDEKSITVKIADGSSKIVFVGNNTSINKAQSGTKEDLKTGEKVMVIGSANSDGSVSATNIQLNPGERFNISID